MNLKWQRKLSKWWLILRLRRFPSRSEVDIFLAFKVRQGMSQTRFIGVTGSAGKSTTSALLLFLLSARFPTAASLLHNNTKDIAQRLIEVQPGDQYVVVEMSGHEPGALLRGCQLVQPDTAIVTTVSADHYRNFRSLDLTAREKSTLVSSVKRSGKVFLNLDDPRVAAMANATEASVSTFGTGSGADYQAIDPHINDQGNLTFICAHAEHQAVFEIALPAMHFVTAALAAIACAHQAGIALSCLAERARLFTGLKERCSLHSLSHDRQLICDTAKAPYATLEQAFSVLSVFTTAPRKTLVLGAFSDYPGAFSPKLRKVVNMAFNYADRIFLLKPAHIPSELPQPGPGQSLDFVDSLKEIRELLEGDILPGEVIMLKAAPVSELVGLLELYGEVVPSQAQRQFDTAFASLDARWAACSAQMASSLVRLAPPVP